MVLKWTSYKRKSLSVKGDILSLKEQATEMGLILHPESENNL